jgi:hypothetical protein
MQKLRIILPLFVVLALVFIGCQGGENFVSPQNSPASFSLANVWTETLGMPDIMIADGSGVVVAGTGMLSQPGTINFNVPGTEIKQVLLYWSGGTVQAPYNGDNTIIVDGTEITGEVIGGPAYFFLDYYFISYRADITMEGLVSLGANSLSVEGMNFPGSNLNENNGVGILVIYDDGTSADIQLRDGLDLAFFDFPTPRDATEPQTFTFDPANVDRTADVFVMCGSVGVNRPNQIKVDVDGNIQTFDNELGSNDGPLWDTKVLPVNVPAGASALTIEVISVVSANPLGASLSWIVGGFSLPIPEPPGEGCSRTIGYWKTHAGFGPQDDVVTQYLPIWLGNAGGDKSIEVTSAAIAVDVLKMKTYGKNNNGITKLYAQLLAAKLNFAADADDSDVADKVSDADDFLADHDWNDWKILSDADQDMVMDWQGALDMYNNGDIGPGHCGDGDEMYND